MFNKGLYWSYKCQWDRTLRVLVQQIFVHIRAVEKDFVKNFIPISMTTMFIIVVVKSSLALSLGLVGALSIVRFRTVIKEPEELGYLFLCIALGLGNGASQYLVTSIALVTILSAIYIFSSKKENVSQDMGFIYTDSGENITPTKQIVDIFGGEIKVSSQKGVGSSFVVYLNLEEDESHVEDIENIKESDMRIELRYYKKIKILIAEDNLMNQDVIKGYLGNFDFEID